MGKEQKKACHAPGDEARQDELTDCRHTKLHCGGPVVPTPTPTVWGSERGSGRRVRQKKHFIHKLAKRESVFQAERPSEYNKGETTEVLKGVVKNSFSWLSIKHI